jgi:hypothetical protein
LIRPILCAVLLALPAAALAAQCRLEGVEVTCDDGRRGILAGDSIVWPDGTRSSATPHASVIIGNRNAIRVGPGVMLGDGKGGSRPMDDPNAPNKRNCAHLNGIAYCH